MGRKLLDQRLVAEFAEYRALTGKILAPLVKKLYIRSVRGF